MELQYLHRFNEIAIESARFHGIVLTFMESMLCLIEIVRFQLNPIDFHKIKFIFIES